jgi:hypothetical protein
MSSNFACVDVVLSGTNPGVTSGCYARIYGTMDVGKIPLEEGKSPLDTLLRMLGDISMAEFARRLGVNEKTVRLWRKGVHPATFTLPQLKILKNELEAVGLSLEDLPDSFAPYHAKSA